MEECDKCKKELGKNNRFKVRIQLLNYWEQHIEENMKTFCVSCGTKILKEIRRRPKQ